jgi:hypothetical protein
MASDPNAAAERWAAGLSAAGPKITAGVNAVTTAPGMAAARQKAVYVANVAASADKWATNVSSVSLSDWQQAMINKGVNRISGGATAAQPKFLAVMQQLLPQIDRIKSGLPPRGNLEQNIARMTAFTRAMSQVKITK